MKRYKGFGIVLDGRRSTSKFALGMRLIFDTLASIRCIKI